MTLRVTFAARAGSIGARLFHDCCRAVLEGEKKTRATVGVVLLDDPAIHALNKRYLRHDFPTDVITFPLGEGRDLEAEIYISVDTARRQAREYRVTLREELARLAVHGVLHACGHDDASDAQRERMRILENRYLNVVFGGRMRT
jgi:probable rRNA maturation factor